MAKKTAWELAQEIAASEIAINKAIKQWNDFTSQTNGNGNIAFAVKTINGMAIGAEDNSIIFQNTVFTDIGLAEWIRQERIYQERLVEIFDQYQKLLETKRDAMEKLKNMIPYGCSIELGNVTVSRNKSGTISVKEGEVRS